LKLNWHLTVDASNLQAGFTDVVHVDGGLNGWRNEDFPTEEVEWSRLVELKVCFGVPGRNSFEPWPELALFLL
jgi:hypothetical protein